jgi:hypothetical protein
VEPPPRDADEWPEERWLAWLNAPENQAVDEPPPPPRPKARGSEIFGAAMMGLERAMFGRVARPEVVVEVEADGDDDGRRLPDDADPRSTTIVVWARPGVSPRPDDPSAGRTR